MPVEGLRSPYDKKAGGLHHFGRMIDKIRLMQVGALPGHFHPNYGMGAGLDGHLCGFVNVEFKAIEERVKQGGTDEEIVEWVFARGLRPNKMQARIWNECSRKFGWNDVVSKYLANLKKEEGVEHLTAPTSFELIEIQEGRKEPY